MKLTSGSPAEIEQMDFVAEAMGLDPDLFDILIKECTEVFADDENRIRAYTTVWDYEIPYTIKTNEDLRATVREIIANTYDGIEEFMPDEYRAIL